MPPRVSTALFAALLLSSPPLRAQSPAAPLTAAEIMSRVAANQDRSEAERAHFVYVQHARVISRKGKTVRCEEITDFRVTPGPHGSQQQLLKLDGRLLYKGKYLTYHALPDKNSGTDVRAENDDIHINIGSDDPMDRDLVENMRHNLTDSRSKDGLGADLFPLTTKAQAGYTFKLAGREPMLGRDTFHIVFLPKDKDEFTWKGDAYIDAAAFQPVYVRTTMARKLPFAVRTLLGTSLPGLGFSVTYEPQTGDIWFPVTFGTEFRLHVFFFLNREIVMDIRNRDFERTHVNSHIIPPPPGVPAPEPPPQP